MTTYSIDDSSGNLLTSGMQYHNVWSTAQRIADERGESVYVYEVRVGSDDDEPTSTTEVQPKS